MWTRGNILGMFPAAVLQFYRLGFGLFHGAPCAKGGVLIPPSKPGRWEWSAESDLGCPLLAGDHPAPDWVPWLCWAVYLMGDSGPWAGVAEAKGGPRTPLHSVGV